MIKILFFVGIFLAASGFMSTPLALLAGLAFGLSGPHPYRAELRWISSFLLQASVVGLGFGMNLHEVLRAGERGFSYTAAGIVITLLVGLGLSRLIGVNRTPGLLISAGTAICGGSAIAAVGPVLEANEEEMAVSLGTVFILNSAALFVFPAVGGALHLSQEQFGLWSALAIHDTSSVVGATAKYGAGAMVIGTTIKLARALWIVPVTLAVASRRQSKQQVKWPWFILWFCVAIVINTYLPSLNAFYSRAYDLGKTGLTVTLFLIGSGISKPLLKSIGIRPLVLGTVLWALIASLTLLFIWTGAISA